MSATAMVGNSGARRVELRGIGTQGGEGAEGCDTAAVEREGQANRGFDGNTFPGADRHEQARVSSRSSSSTVAPMTRG